MMTTRPFRFHGLSLAPTAQYRASPATIAANLRPATLLGRSSPGDAGQLPLPAFDASRRHGEIAKPQTERALGGTGLGPDLVVGQASSSESATLAPNLGGRASSMSPRWSGDPSQPPGQGLVAHRTDDGSDLVVGLAEPTQQRGAADPVSGVEVVHASIVGGGSDGSTGPSTPAA